jgi:hypothetical protein
MQRARDGFGRRRQHRRALGRAFHAGLQLGELLREQFLGLDPLPGRVAVVFERRHRHVGRGVVQEGQRAAQVPRAAQADLHGDRLVEHRARQARAHLAPQHRLREARDRRVDRRERLGQRGARGFDGGMHDLPPDEAAAHLAPHAHRAPTASCFCCEG